MLAATRVESSGTPPRDPKLESVYRLALSALGAIGSAVLIVTREGTILYANPRAGDLFGRPVEDLARYNVAALLEPVDAMVTTQRRAQQSSEVRTEITSRRADGTVMTIGYSISELPRLPADVGPDRFVLVFQDISPYIAIRRERDRLVRRAGVAELLPSILHELKNPLAAMTTAVELLLEEVADESVQRDLRGIFKEIRRLDLGMQGFAVAGRDLRSRHPVDVADAIREAVRVLEPVAEDAQIGLRAQIDELPLVALNADVVRGLVFNIVRSSIAACSAGDRIVISARIGGDGSSFELVAEDTGPEPQAVIPESGATRLGRIGVAILLCKRACEFAGGGITLNKREGGGAVVVLRIPDALPKPLGPNETLY